MLNKVLVYLMVIIIYGTIRKLIQKKLKVKEGLIYQRVNNLHTWLEALLLILLLIGHFVWVLVFNNPVAGHEIFVIFTILFAFRTIFEYKFDNKSKRYVISCFDCAVFFIIYLISEFIFY